MWSRRGKDIEVHLGSETDEELCARLVSSLESIGGEKVRMDTDYAGSQELTTVVYRVGQKEVLLTIETYSGVTLSGERSLVERIAALLKSDQ